MKKSVIAFLFNSLSFSLCISLAHGGENCYGLGYKYGMCKTKSMQGIPCEDIVIPEKCRGKKETKRGIQEGSRAVYYTLNLDNASSESEPPSSLNMLSTSLDVLRDRLTGKTESEVKNMVGSPDRIDDFAGDKCWIYGNTHTYKDRQIIFDKGRVLTVTSY